MYRLIAQTMLSVSPAYAADARPPEFHIEGELRLKALGFASPRSVFCSEFNPGATRALEEMRASGVFNLDTIGRDDVTVFTCAEPSLQRSSSRGSDTSQAEPRQRGGIFRLAIPMAPTRSKTFLRAALCYPWL